MTSPSTGDRLLVGKGQQPVYLLAKYGNRHGLVAGATGTGKTVSLMVMAEGLLSSRRAGVSRRRQGRRGGTGHARARRAKESSSARREIGVEGYASEASPVVFWDLYGKAGHPVRTTVSEMGPSLLARILELNDTQAGVLEVAFKLADDRGLLLLDLDDLRALLGFVADNRKEISTAYGLVSATSIAAIQRALLTLDREGGEAIFGEPALELADLMRTDLGGRGVVSILAADQLILKPRLYSSFLLWLLSELFENLPEVGRPRQAASSSSASTRRTCSSTTRRPRCASASSRSCASSAPRASACTSARSSPTTCRTRSSASSATASSTRCALTRRAIRRPCATAAETFVPNPALDVAAVISQLAVGEALVSTLQEKGVPCRSSARSSRRRAVAWARSRPEERAAVRARSPVGAKYDPPREPRVGVRDPHAPAARGERARSAPRGARPAPDARDAPPRQRRAGARGQSGGGLGELLWGTKRRQGMVETLAKQAARTVGSEIGRQILRGVLGGILGGSRRR